MTYYNIQLEALVFFLQTVRSKLRLITAIQEKVFSLKIISKKKNINTKNHSHTNYNKAKLEILIQPSYHKYPHVIYLKIDKSRGFTALGLSLRH